MRKIYNAKRVPPVAARGILFGPPPMPPPLSERVRQEIELALRCGDPVRTIIDAYLISDSQVRKIKENLIIHDTVAPDLRYLIPQGRPRKVTSPIKRDVLEFI